MVLHLYKFGNYERCIELGMLISKRLVIEEVDDHHVQQIHLSLQLLIGQAKLFGGRYLTGFHEIEQVLKEMLKDPVLAHPYRMPPNRTHTAA